jgi:hypothetical protein
MLFPQRLLRFAQVWTKVSTRRKLDDMESARDQSRRLYKKDPVIVVLPTGQRQLLKSNADVAQVVIINTRTEQMTKVAVSLCSQVLATVCDKEGEELPIFWCNLRGEAHKDAPLAPYADNFAFYQGQQSDHVRSVSECTVGSRVGAMRASQAKRPNLLAMWSFQTKLFGIVNHKDLQTRVPPPYNIYVCASC